MRGGDREAEFREYVVADRSRLMRTAMLLTAGDVHTAEDQLPSFNEPMSISPYADP